MGERVGAVIALDIGGTKVAGAIARADGGELMYREQTPTRAWAGPEALLATVIALARRLQAHCSEARAVGVGSAGQIDHHSGQVIYANDNLPGWTGMELGRRLGAAVGLPVYADNDVNAMALAEALRGAGAGRRVVVVVAVGTGIGGALVLDGQLFRGATGVAGELGHIPVVMRGALCVCGKRGCLEAYASGPRIAAAYTRAASLSGAVELPEVTAQARAGDPLARAALARAGRRIGWALAGLVNTLNPDMLIVGGGVAEAGDLLLTPLRAALRAQAQGPASTAVEVRPALLGADAALLGAALLVPAAEASPC